MRTFAAIIFALLFTFSAVAAPVIPEAVSALIPPTATLVESEYDDGAWEYDFRDGDMRYEVIYDGNAVVALTTRNKAVQPAKTNLLTEETATLNLEGTVLYAKAEKDDGGWVWKVIVQTETDLIEYELHGETGEILETEVYFGATITLPEAYRSLDLEWDDGRVKLDLD